MMLYFWVKSQERKLRRVTIKNMIGIGYSFCFQICDFIEVFEVQI